MADTKHPAFAAWCQVQGYVDRLFGSAEALDEAGGVEQAAASAQWTAKTLARALATIEDARVALEELHERMHQIVPADAPRQRPMPRPAPQPAPVPSPEPARAPLANRTRSRMTA